MVYLWYSKCQKFISNWKSSLDSIIYRLIKFASKPIREQAHPLQQKSNFECIYLPLINSGCLQIRSLSATYFVLVNIYICSTFINKSIIDAERHWLSSSWRRGATLDPELTRTLRHTSVEYFCGHHGHKRQCQRESGNHFGWTGRSKRCCPGQLLELCLI